MLIKVAPGLLQLDISSYYSDTSARWNRGWNFWYSLHIKNCRQKDTFTYLVIFIHNSDIIFVKFTAWFAAWYMILRRMGLLFLWKLEIILLHFNDFRKLQVIWYITSVKMRHNILTKITKMNIVLTIHSRRFCIEGFHFTGNWTVCSKAYPG